MKFITAMLSIVLFSMGSSAFAQDDLPPPPPPPPAELDEPERAPAADPDGEADPEGDTISDIEPAAPAGLSISTPVAGAAVPTATEVVGTAPAGSTVEIYVDDEFEARLKVDQSGTFRTSVAGLTEGTRPRIEVRQIDAGGEVVSSTSVVVRAGAAAPPPPSEPEVSPPPPIERSPEPAPSPVQPAPSPVTPSEIEAPVSQPVRGLLSTGAGFVAGPLGFILGFFSGALIGLAYDGGNGFAAIAFALLGGLTVYAIAVPAAVITTAYLLDGNGNILLTSLASVGALALGLLAVSVIGQGINSEGAAVALVGSSTLFGAAAGAAVYELTSDPSRRAAEAAEKAEGVTIRPSLAPSADSRGVVLGLSGTW